MEFEWEKIKAETNEHKHGVSFIEASVAFKDPKAIEFFDELNSDDEIRFRLLAFSPKRFYLLALLFGMMK